MQQTPWMFLIALYTSCLLSAQAYQTLPIIDMHQHARNQLWTDDQEKPMPLMCFPEPCEKVPAMVKKEGDVLKISLEMMKKHRVVKAVVSDKDLGDVQKWVKAAPEVYLAGKAIGHPAEINIQELKQLIETGKVKVIGELLFQYERIAADDPLLDPIYALAQAYDLPVLFHVAGLGGSPDFPIHLGSPLRLAKVLKKFPTLRLYVENAGWPFLPDIISLMYQYPNVYADLSTITWIIPRETFHEYLRGLMKAQLGKRLMFGSDQMFWPEAIELGIQAIQEADFLTELQKRDIFYNNAARFLKLSEAEIAAHHK